MALVPLYDLTQQFQNKNGSILVAGKLFVYYIGRPDLATTWADDGASAVNPNPILLDNNGRAPCFVDDGYSYTLVVCDRNGQELFSQDITPGGAGSVGGRVVYHDETLSGTGTVSSLLGVSNIPLGVDETMTAYTGVVDNKDALILGVNGDWFNTMYSGMESGYVTKEEFSACCSAVKGGLDNKVDLSALDNYYTKYEVNSALSNKVDVNYFIDYTSSMEDRLEHKLTFQYDENSAISSINNSALAGGNGGYSPWISASKVIGETSSLVPGQWFQVLSSIDVSGIQNHCIGVKGAAFTFPTTSQFYDWLSLWQYLPSATFNNFISGSYQPNINTLYSSAGWMMYNKLDSSAFSAWTAEYSHDDAETYTVVGGHFIDISADDDLKQTTISVTGVDEALQLTSGTLHNEIASVSSDLSSFSASTVYDLGNKKVKQSPITLSGENQVITALYQNSNGEISAAYGESVTGGDYTPWISGAKILADTQTMTDNMIIQVLSSFTLSGNKNHCIAVKGGTYRFPNKYEIASGINETNTFLTNSAFNTYTDLMNGYVNDLYGRDGYLSGRINELSSYAVNVSSTVKSNSSLWNQVNTAVNNYVTTNSSNIDLATSLVIANEEHWSDTYNTVGNTSAKWEDASNKVIANSAQWDDATNKLRSNSAQWNDTTNKVRSNSAQWAKNDGDSAVNNWVYNNSSTCETTNTNVGLNSNFWSNTCFVVMDNSASWGQGGNPFPITGRNGNTSYTHGADCSSFYLSNSVGRAGSVVSFYNNYINFAAYPATDVSATWYNIINAANSRNITCSAVKLTTAASETRFYTSALPNLNEITFIAPSYGPYGTYSALIDDGDTTFVAEIDSGCCMKVVRNWNDNRNKNCWCGLNQETYFYIG